MSTWTIRKSTRRGVAYTIEADGCDIADVLCEDVTKDAATTNADMLCAAPILAEALRAMLSEYNADGLETTKACEIAQAALDLAGAL